MDILLEALRTSLGYESKELADLLTISEAEYQSMELGLADLTEEQATAIVKLFKSTIGNTPGRAGNRGTTIYNVGSGRTIINITNNYGLHDE
jgi:hypothetical protein